MAKIKEIIVLVEVWGKKTPSERARDGETEKLLPNSILAIREVAIKIPDVRPIDQGLLIDACQRAVANALDLLKNNLDNQ